MPHKLITRIAHAEIAKKINRDLAARELDELENAFELIVAKTIDAARSRVESRLTETALPLEHTALSAERA